MTCVVSGWTTCDTYTTFCTNSPASMHCKRRITGRPLRVPGYIVYGTDHGRTAILCPREVNHFRRSWVDNERCTAILVATTMLLSVYMPHSGYDEVDYIEALESVRATLTAERREGAVDFSIGGDLNIELSWTSPTRSIEARTALNGAGCTGLSAEEAVRVLLLMRKIEVVPVIARLQLRRDQYLDEQ